jgi:N-dimethylarginine dimethylaminohydrolase
MPRKYPTESQLDFLHWLAIVYPGEIDAPIQNVLNGQGYAFRDITEYGISNTSLYLRQFRLNEVRDKYLQEYKKVKKCT